MKPLLFLSFLLTTATSYLFGQTYSEILGRPTDSAITVSVLFYQQADIYVEYGTQSGSYLNSTTPITNTIGTPDEIDLLNLTPNTKYYYRTRYKPTGTSTYLAGSEHFFHTQRPAGSTFTFTIESDVHLYDKKGVRSIYDICLQNQAADNPDFMFDLGDTYGDDHRPTQMTSEYSDSLHRVYRPILGKICHSIPYFFCLGNHEGEFNYYLPQTPPNNIAVYGTLWRKFYYPNPYPNNFYSGNTDVEGYGMGNPENYYSFTWGDALFVVLDVYRYQCDTSAKPTNWAWTLGYPQYSWLKSTLEGSSAKYKFVFAHQIRGQGRGGVLDAKYYEWGGYEGNGTVFGFTNKRPGWDKPIHQLFVDNGVNVFFHGHDHLFSHEILDGVTYQEIPMPSDSTYKIGMLANADAYASDTIDGSGHIRVVVSPDCVKIDYVSVYLPLDTISGVHHNRGVAFSYTIGDCSTSISNNKEVPNVRIYPNPASDKITIKLPNEVDRFQAKLMNSLGQTVLQSQSKEIDVSGLSNGIYFLNIKTSTFEINKKVIVRKH
jgi:hypothetical protein